MKILKILLMIALPTLLIINLASFFGQNPHFVSTKVLIDYLSTFNGLDNTVSSLTEVGVKAAIITTSKNFIDAVVNIANLIWAFFTIIISFIQDMISDVFWVLGILKL